MVTWLQQVGSDGASLGYGALRSKFSAANISNMNDILCGLWRGVLKLFYFDLFGYALNNYMACSRSFKFKDRKR